MWDTQHAVLFSQSLCMNASELKLTLPWDPNIWEASTATEWHHLIQNTPSPPQYLSILKMYTNPSSSSPPPQLNVLSRVLILHGLMSISWDLNRRDQTSLSLSVTNSIVPWRTRLSNCYTSWKQDFDQYTQSVLSSLSFPSANHAKFQRFVVANLAVYHTAQLILEVDIIDLQIHAGARHIIGRPVTDSDRARSRTKISQWIARDEGLRAGKAVYHAARLFRDGVRKLENWNVDEMFHYPWCLYLSTLMCWTFHGAASQNNSPYSLPPHHNSSTACSSSSSPPSVVTKSSTDFHSDATEDEDGDWDSAAEMNALISELTRLDPSKDTFRTEVWHLGAKYRTHGLVRCMVKQLNTIRWAVVREGMVVLRSLQ
jgi:Fungal specific transcription factor domain